MIRLPLTSGVVTMLHWLSSDLTNVTLHLLTLVAGPLVALLARLGTVTGSAWDELIVDYNLLSAVGAEVRTCMCSCVVACGVCIEIAFRAKV